MSPRKANLIGFVATCAVRLLISTLRFKIDDQAGAQQGDDPRLIWLFWHNRLLILPHVWSRVKSRPKGAALTSASKDGEILSAFLRRYGLRPVRGSSSRRGVAALIELIRLTEDGYDVAITPDGPRGPRYKVSPGAITLAQKTGAKIMPIDVCYSSYWQLKSWDAFMIPKPFSRVEITLRKPEPVALTNDADAFEQERARIEKLLLEGA
jgi:lysophospholipid acyltransferase (LPLAT)-like uncharacterized protein